MAYTYDDFLNKANSSGMLGEFSQEDLATTQKHPEFGLSLLTLKQDASKATTAEGRLLAQEAETQLRKSYNSAAGDLQTPGITVGSETNSATAGAQTAADSENGEGNVPQVTQGSFLYDPEEDPRYAAYKKAYLREGDRAAANALAQASALTGGVPSTAAIAASQQAGDYYAGKLADIIPELYSDAYNQHVTEQQLQADLELQKISNALNLYKTLGYATPEIAQILGLHSTQDGNQTGSTTGSTGNDSDHKVNWDNQGYDKAEIAKLQNWLGVEVDGLFGLKSKAALEKAGYSSLEQAMQEQPWLSGPGDGQPGSETGTGTETTDGLSANAQSLLKRALTFQPYGDTMFKNTLLDSLSAAYENGLITEQDFKTIAYEYGL